VFFSAAAGVVVCCPLSHTQKNKTRKKTQKNSGIKGCAKCNATTKACTKCAPLLYVLNAAANTCDCAAGYGAYLKNGAPVLGAKCLPCVVPTYQDTVTTPGVAVCTACPSNTSVPTPTLGTDVSQCTVCAPGYGDETGASNPLACTICAAGSYMYNASAPCTPCADPAYTTPTAGSFTGKLCTVPVCAPNTQLGKGANKKLVCLPCPAGTCSPGGDPTQGLLQPKCTAC
jgi:hypothetical protein